jgi:hypothetical protein
MFLLKDSMEQKAELGDLAPLINGKECIVFR